MANIIFDFDGTLADTLHIAVSLFRKFAQKSHPTDDAEIERLRGLSAREVVKSLGIPWWRLPYFVYEGRKAVQQQMGSVKAIAGIEPVVHELHEKEHKLFILSSNSTENIAKFLDNNKLRRYFDGFWGGQGIFAKSAALKKIVRKNSFNLEDCVYIGDEVRDVEAARHAGMKCIAVSWGYNNRKALKAANPPVLVDNPKELLGFLKAYR